jgi:hypothetical protein
MKRLHSTHAGYCHGAVCCWPRLLAHTTTCMQTTPRGTTQVPTSLPLNYIQQLALLSTCLAQQARIYIHSTVADKLTFTIHHVHYPQMSTTCLTFRFLSPTRYSQQDALSLELHSLSSNFTALGPCTCATPQR